MSSSTLSLITLGLYLVLLAPMCLKARKSQYDRNASNHYLANRSLGFMVLLLTLYATTFSGNSMMGSTGQAYRIGYLWVMFIGLVMASVVSFHFVAPKLRPLAIKHQFITPGDWLRYRFQDPATGPVLRIFITVCLCLSLANFLLSQLKAAGEILEVMTEGTLPYSMGVLIFALVVLVYDAMGGLRAVAWTDVFQGLIMLAGTLCLLAWVINHTGGIEHLTHKILETRPGSDQLPSLTQQIKWFSVMLLGGISVVVYPQALQRIYAAKSQPVLHQSLASMGGIMFLATTILVFVGWSAIPLLNPDLITSEDQVLPKLLSFWSEQGSWYNLAALLVILAILAAIMSTADSVLLSLVSMIRHDFLDNSDRNHLKYDGFITALIMIPIACMALYRDVSLWRLVELKLELLLQCFPAIVLALHWKKVKAFPILTGLIAGLILLSASLVIGIKQINGINFGLIALAVNLLLVFFLHGVYERKLG